MTFPFPVAVNQVNNLGGLLLKELSPFRIFHHDVGKLHQKILKSFSWRLYFYIYSLFFFALVIMIIMFPYFFWKLDRRKDERFFFLELEKASKATPQLGLYRVAAATARKVKKKIRIVGRNRRTR